MRQGADFDIALEEAFDWILAVDDASDDACLRGRVEDWLGQSSINQKAWDRARATWQAGGPDLHALQLGVSQGEGWVVSLVSVPETPSPKLLSWQNPRAKYVMTGAIAACLCFILSPFTMPSLMADHATQTGELRDVILADGTLVKLGPNSAINVDYSADRREVELVSGQAWFDVKHAPQRPFLIDSNGVQTRVLGTAFEVKMLDTGSRVAVERGLVEVGLSDDNSSIRKKLRPGEGAYFDHASGEVLRIDLAIDHLATWRDGMVLANDNSIDEVVDDLEEYMVGWVVFADENIAQKRVTGLYDASEPRDALGAMLEPVGGRITQVTPYLTIISSE